MTWQTGIGILRPPIHKQVPTDRVTESNSHTEIRRFARGRAHVLAPRVFGLALLLGTALVAGSAWQASLQAPQAPVSPLAAPRPDVAVSELPVLTRGLNAAFAESAALFRDLWREAERGPDAVPAEKAEPATAVPGHIVKTVAVGRGDTLGKMLAGAGIAVEDAMQAIDALRDKFNPRRLQLGQEITLTLARDGADTYRLASLSLPDSVERLVTVTRGDDGFVASEILKALETAPVRTGAVIESSLYQAALEAGLPMPVLTELIRIFSYDVDFQREVQPGDSFEVFYDEMLDENGKAVKAGVIRAASMNLSGQMLRFFRFEGAGGDVDYYDPRGRGVRKALLRTPIDGARLSSGFGLRRHPVLGFSRMHKGVDFAAPSGTPIQAAGDGLVEVAGWQGGYGNYVRIRPASNFSTAYGHMSRIAVKAGQRVKQGQIVGNVGSTGVSTGPHLHYETMREGQHINPLSIKLPAGRQLEGRELAVFQSQVDEVERRMAATPIRSQLAQGR